MANWDPNVYGQYPEITEGMRSSGQGPWGPLLPNELYLYNGQFVRYEPGSGALLSHDTQLPVHPGNGESGDGGGNNGGGTPTPAPPGGTLPQYPLTQGLGYGMFPGLDYQIWNSLQPRDANAIQFGRFNFDGSQGGGLPGGGSAPPSWTPGLPPREQPDTGIPPWRNPPATPPGRQYGPPSIPNPRQDGRPGGLLPPAQSAPPQPTPQPPAPPINNYDPRGSGGLLPDPRSSAYPGRVTGGLLGGDPAREGRMPPMFNGAPTPPPPATGTPGLPVKPLSYRSTPTDMTLGRQTVSTLPPQPTGGLLRTGSTAGDFGAAPRVDLGSMAGSPQWGNWVNFQFDNPTEAWQTQWNALDPSLRPMYAAAATQTPQSGGAYTNQRLGLRPIYSALESLAPNLFPQAKQEAAQFFNTAGVNNWRLSPTGELMQLQKNSTGLDPTGGFSWNIIASGLQPGAYVPTK